MRIKQIRDIFPNALVARYNLTAWLKNDSGSIIFVGREVSEPGKEGEPDVGKLKMYESNENRMVVQGRLLWEPKGDGINLEDPRALLLDKNLIIGLTAVLRDEKRKPVPYPAIVKIDSHDTWDNELPPFSVIKTFGPGKNLTPIDSSTFLFRPDSLEYHHKILVFTLLDQQEPKKLADIKFPKNLFWAKWRIGTTVPPIWLNSEEALLIIHGISIKEVNGQDKYIYSIGRAKLTKKENVFTVDVAPEPILTPDNFVKNGQPLVEELHSNRQVVYSCGGIIKKGREDTLFLYVNVGDRTTFEVEFSMNELKEELFS